MDKNNDAMANVLKWRFDVSTFRLIGRDLITDRITALFELVKNCYDANATRVDILFENVGTVNPYSQIIVKDNGTGMAFSDVSDKWMVIGTSSKRDSKYTPSPFNRRYVGEKGIGRFAVDKIGEKVNILTKKEDSKQWLNVNIDWHNYEELASRSQLTLFTDVENTYNFEDGGLGESGTTLFISQVRDVWTRRDVDRLYQQLTKLVSPIYPLNPPFEIYISSNEYTEYKEKLVQSDAISFASHFAKINFDPIKGTQEILKFDSELGRIITTEIPIRSFGGVKMELYYFNPEAKRKYSNKYKGEDAKIDGVKIYRDGLITTPFAEFEEHPDKKRDVLGIDKRLWRDIFNRVSTREVIGILDITKEGNPKIVDATNRQDFDDTSEFRALKQFIIEQLDIFSEIKIYERQTEKKGVTDNLLKAREDVSIFSNVIEQIEGENPQLRTALEPLKKQARQVGVSVKKGIAEYKKAQKEFVRKENIYLSLMSLQEYAINIAHAVRTSLGKVKRRAEFFKDRFPNANLENYFKEYAVEIYNEMQTLNKVIDFMLSYAGSNMEFEDFSVKELLDEIFTQYSVTFESEKINALVEIADNFVINGNKQFFADIFQNLIANSIKALKDVALNKIIKCTGYLQDDHFILYFSDNGIGIDKDLWNKVFELYYTTTEKDGGGGVGLFIVKTRIEALKGVVEVCESEFKPNGATFKITFPFKK